MLNADDLRRCECCEEPTKKVVGFWEGHDSYSGSPRAGAIYSCDNHECDICKEKMSEKESDELLKERVDVYKRQAFGADCAIRGKHIQGTGNHGAARSAA